MDKGKVVTLENLGTFKTEMDKSVDAKVAAGGAGSDVAYATEEDILALFADNESVGGEEPPEE